MSFKKKAVSLLLTGTLAATVLAPTALAGDGYGGHEEYMIPSIYSKFEGSSDEIVPLADKVVPDTAADGYIMTSEMEYDDFQHSGSLTLSSQTNYETDANGKLLKYISKSEGTEYGGSEIVIYNYDKSDKLASFDVYYDGFNFEGAQNGLDAHIDLTYDENGNVIKDEASPWHGKNSAGYAYTYDSRGRLAESLYHFDDTIGIFSSAYKELYTYDDNNNIIKYDIIEYSDSEEYHDTTNYQYDANNRLLKAGSTTYKYNNRGKLAECYEESGGDKYTYEYDTKDRLVLVKLNGSPLKLYAYDDNGRLQSSKILYIGDTRLETYEYDKAGNLIKANSYSNDKLISYTTYKYKKLGSTSEPHVGQFTDVLLSSYYADAVKWAVENEITSGTSNTAFSPDNSCTRAQIMQMLWRAMGSPEPATSNNPFTDVKEGDYYYKAVLWAVENNITSGTTKTTFGSNATCTRGQAMTFLWNAKGKQSTSNSIAFTDVKSGDYFYNPVKWAVGKGITSGTSPATFSPAQNCTRAQIVTFIYKADVRG